MHRHTLALVATAALGVAACRPDYPVCDADEDCASHGEVCVSRQCQECREDAQCSAGAQSCVGGRCDAAQAQAPQAPQCASGADCAGGRRCEAGACVAGCGVDLDCGPGHACLDGACQASTAALPVSSTCSQYVGAGGTLTVPPVRFGFNEDTLTAEARGALDAAAPCLQTLPTAVLVIEGHGDERGTQEYNLALGEKRAASVESYLARLGVDPAKVRTVSKGENAPVCHEATEPCWTQNRRVELRAGRER